MAKLENKYRQRPSDISVFGKDLTRRSKAKCELCETGNTKLSVYEVPPIITGEEPVYENCLFLCEECIKKLQEMHKIQENEWRFLGNSMWSELSLSKALSIYLLQKISSKYEWASDFLDMAYIDEEIQTIIDRIDLPTK